MTTSKHAHEGPAIVLPAGTDAEPVKQRLLEKYQTCARDLMALRRGHPYQANEQPIFAPLRYRVGLLGELLSKGSVHTQDLSRFFSDEDHLIHVETFEAACREIESEIHASPALGSSN